MKSRLTMITRQVREVKNVEDEVRQMRRQLDNFDRYAYLFSKDKSNSILNMHNLTVKRWHDLVYCIPFLL